MFKINKRAIMQYAWDLKRHSKLTFSECLKSAYEAARYIKGWDLQLGKSYTSTFELITGENITWVPRYPENAIWADMQKYGTN